MSSDRAALLMPLWCGPSEPAETQGAAVNNATECLMAWLDFCQSHREIVLTVCVPEDLLPLVLSMSDAREPMHSLAAEGRIHFGTWAGSFDASRLRGETALSALTRARAIVGGLFGAQTSAATALIAGVHGDAASLLAPAGATVILEAGSPATSPALCQVVAASGARLWRCRLAAATTATEIGVRAIQIGADTAPGDALQAAATAEAEPAYGGLDRARERVIEAAERMWAALPVVAGVLEAEPAASPDLAAAAALAENAMIDAERVTAVAAASGAAAYPDLALDYGWRQVLYGMRIAVAPQPTRSLRYDALAACQEAAQTAAGAADQAAIALAGQIDTAGHGKPGDDTQVILVVNPLGYVRTDLAQARIDWPSAAAGFILTDQRARTVQHQVLRSGQYDDGRRWADVCFVAEEVPALGWRTYFARRATSPPAQADLRETAEAVIENGFLRVAASLPAGGVTSITDKGTRRELLRGGVGGSVIEAETGKTRAPTAMRTEIGPLLSRILLTGDHPELGRWRQTLSLWAGVPRLYVELVFDGAAEARPVRMLWRLAGPGQMPVWGTEGGAWVGALDQARPVRNWLDLGHTALMRRGRAAHAIGPCAVIAPRRLQMPARELVAALVSAGVPARTASPEDVPDLGHGATCIVLGAARENDHIEALLDRADEDVRGRFGRALEREGVAIGLLPGAARQCTVVAAARDGEQLSQLVTLWSSSLAKGEIELSRDTVVAGEVPTVAPDGVAIIGDGSLMAQVTVEGEVSVELNAGDTARFALLAHRRDWQSADLRVIGDALAHPLRAVAAETSPGSLPTVSSPVELKGDAVAMSLRLPAGGAAVLRPNTPTPTNSLFLSVLEPHGREQEIKIASPWPLISAWRCDPLGERQAEMALTRGKDPVLRMAANETATVELALDCPAPPAPGERAAASDDLGATPVRYWEWGLGAAPLASVPVAACLHGQPKIGETTRFTLTVVNNQLDAEARGAVRVSAPEGWRLTPTQVPYRLPPGGQHTYEVAVIIPPGEPPGTITAEVEWRQHRFADTLVIGDWRPLECSLERREAQLAVRVSNPNAREVTGLVAIITPWSRWQSGAAGGYRGGAVAPLRRPFAVPPDGETEICFDWRGDTEEAIPIAAKVMYHRRADYIAPGEHPTE